MSFATILQLVKTKAQQGQITMPQFVKIVDNSEQQQDKTDGTKDQCSKTSAQIGESVKQSELNKKTSTQTSDQPVILQTQKEQVDLQQTQQINVLSQLTTQFKDNQPTEEKQPKDISSLNNESTNQSDLKTDKNKSEQIKKVDMQDSKINIQLQSLSSQQQQTVQINNRQEKFVNQENIQPTSKNLTQQINKSTVNQLEQQNQPLDNLIQKFNQGRVKESTSNQDQIKSKSTSNTQNSLQVTQNNKNSERFTKISEQGIFTQKQSLDTTSIQEKVTIDQTNTSSQTIQTKVNTSNTSQAKGQSNSTKIITPQERSEDQIKIVDTKTAQNENSKSPIQIDQKPQISYKAIQEQIDTELSRSIADPQPSKDNEIKLNKTNTKIGQAMINDTQEQQKIVLSRNVVDYLTSQVQVNAQNMSDNIQKKDRSTQKISQQSVILTENLISNKTSEQSTSSQANTITFKQTQVIIRNAIIQIQDSTSEFTQFKQIKRDLPDQLKISQPIKIENFKLEIAKELKKDSTQIIQQPQTEKLEQTEQVKELLNTKLARKTYENEQTVQTHQEFQKDIDSLIVRIEQQKESSNIQTIAETIKQMQNATIEKATVDLTPPNLGKVEIEIVKQQDKLTVTLKVATDDVKEMLEKSSKDLISRLNTLGFKVEQVDVKTTPKTQEDQLQRDQEHDQQHHEKRQKKQQQEEVNQDDQRD